MKPKDFIINFIEAQGSQKISIKKKKIKAWKECSIIKSWM
jgi:hypothetical protein